MMSEPSIEEQTAFYDQWNTQNRAGGFDEVSLEIRLRGLMVVQKLQDLNIKGARIIEVGCGTGWLSEQLASFGEVTGIDLSPAAIEIAKKRSMTGSFIAGDFFETGFPHESFDIAVCVETLFYVSDQHRFVEKLASLIKPNGYLMLTAINKFVYERSRDIGPPEPGQVRHWLSRKQVEQLLATRFDVLSSVTMEPRGDKGILRFVNSAKLNKLLGIVMSNAAIKSLKEKLGYGGGIVIVASKNR